MKEFHSDEDQVFTFSFSGDARRINFTVDLAEDEPWTDVLVHFLDFLGSVYGYDIRRRVNVEDIGNF